MRVLIHSPFDTLHTLIVLSLDPDTKYSPFGENTTVETVFEWPMSVLIRSSPDTLRTSISKKYLDAKYSLFGENTTPKTGNE